MDEVFLNRSYSIRWRCQLGMITSPVSSSSIIHINYNQSQPSASISRRPSMPSITESTYVSNNKNSSQHMQYNVDTPYNGMIQSSSYHTITAQPSPNTIQYTPTNQNKNHSFVKRNQINHPNSNKSTPYYDMFNSMVQSERIKYSHTKKQYLLSDDMLGTLHGQIRLGIDGTYDRRTTLKRCESLNAVDQIKWLTYVRQTHIIQHIRDDIGALSVHDNANDYFQLIQNNKMYERILFLWSLHNYHNIQYQSGMHRILHSIVNALHTDYHTDIYIQNNENISSDTIYTIVNPQYIESDAYNMFTAVIDKMSSYYIHSALHINVQYECSTVLYNKMHNTFHHTLRDIDPILFNFLAQFINSSLIVPVSKSPLQTPTVTHRTLNDSPVLSDALRRSDSKTNQTSSLPPLTVFVTAPENNDNYSNISNDNTTLNVYSFLSLWYKQLFSGVFAGACILRVWDTLLYRIEDYIEYVAVALLVTQRSKLMAMEHVAQIQSYLIHYPIISSIDDTIQLLHMSECMMSGLELLNQYKRTINTFARDSYSIENLDGSNHRGTLPKRVMREKRSSFLGFDFGDVNDRINNNSDIRQPQSVLYNVEPPSAHDKVQLDQSQFNETNIPCITLKDSRCGYKCSSVVDSSTYEISGYLIKRGGGLSTLGRKSYKMRWFKLDHNQLIYYSASSKTQPSLKDARIDIRKKIIRIVDEEKHQFVICTPAGTDYIDDNVHTNNNRLTPTSPTSQLAQHGTYSVSDGDLDTPCSPTTTNNSSMYPSSPPPNNIQQSSNYIRVERRKSAGKVRAYELFASDRLSCILWSGALKLIADA